MSACIAWRRASRRVGGDGAAEARLILPHWLERASEVQEFLVLELWHLHLVGRLSCMAIPCPVVDFVAVTAILSGLKVDAAPFVGHGAEAPGWARHGVGEP